MLEPGSNWTIHQSQVDLEWTSEGTEEFLGHGVARELRPRSPIGVWCRLEESGTRREKRKSEPRGTGELTTHTPLHAGVSDYYCLLTEGGLIGVGRLLERASQQCHPKEALRTAWRLQIAVPKRSGRYFAALGVGPRHYEMMEFEPEPRRVLKQAPKAGRRANLALQFRLRVRRGPSARLNAWR